MYLIQDVCCAMETLAPLECAYDWDNVGLLVGRSDKPVSSVLVTLSVTNEVVDAALGQGSNLIVAHHPVIFRPLTSLRTDEPSGALLARLIRHDLAVYACHTNLDRASDGLNKWLAQEVGLKDVEVLLPDLTEGAGLGRIGDISATTLGGLAQRLSELWHRPIRMIGDPARPVKRAAVVGGSGGDYAAQAKGAGADVLITGDVDYHAALDAEALGLGVLDAGHFATEQIMVRETARYLRSCLPGIRVIEERGVDPFQFKKA
ncbi:MAG: Nif3-like dinuclear metal center hexameric protein [Firmicutes bacterium]|jgi:dinuclear metal center YbgI/SA1388 family protein|nr:Nif3-like dinuclear metal center hexameric protein [Bacillota bacterium]NLO65770.1 Nif3-like dinuclear metal center hexameric protein [Bacillota bacterium]